VLDPNRPFAPARLRFYYGWVILGLSTLGVLMSIPGQTMGVSVFTGPLLEATGVSRVGLANAYLVGTVASGLLLPLGGRLLDRFGTRVTLIASSLALGGTLTALSEVDRLAAAARLDGPWASLGVLALAFALLRFSGQGMLTMASRNMVPMWFVRRRGIVSGFFNVFISGGFSVAPAILAGCIEVTGDWRSAWRAIALVVGPCMAALAWLLARDTPESCGLHPDGDAGPDTGGGLRASQGLDEEALPPARALRCGAFWAVTLALGLQAAVVTGFTFHIVDLGSEAGLDQSQALALFPPIALVSVVASFGSGALSDRSSLRALLLVMLVAQAVGFAGLVWLVSPAGLVLGVTGMGVAAGLYGQLSTIAVAKLFGRTYLGSISATQMSVLVIGSALGPSLFALSRQYAGSYTPALLGSAVLPFLLLVLALRSRDPTRSGGVW